MGFGERLSRPLEDCVHAASANTRAEQLFGALDRVLARDTVAHRQRRDRRLQARAEAALGYLVGEPRARALSALRTAKALSTVLDHPHRGRGQLFDLVARRLTEGQRAPLR